jgi:small subunit ribosomal protein S4e
MKETKAILNRRKVFIDGKIRTEEHFPVGLMDVIEIPDLSKAYRVLPSKKSGLTLSEITKAEAKFKLCRIENITTVKKGYIQLNLHDGRNILMPVKDPKKKLDIPYKTMGTLKISIPDQKILDYYPNEVNNQAIVMAGKNIGFSGKVSNLIKRFGINASIAVIEAGEGHLINTAYEYSFIIGKDKPSIDLPNE